MGTQIVACTVVFCDARDHHSVGNRSMENLISSQRNSHTEKPPLCPKKYQVPGLNLVSANGYTFLKLPPCASGNGRVKIFIQNSLSKSRTVNTVARVTSKLVRGTPPDVKC